MVPVVAQTYLAVTLYGLIMNVNETPKLNQTKIKIQYVLKSVGETDEHGELLSVKLDYILNYLDGLNEFLQRGGHREISFNLEDAKS